MVNASRVPMPETAKSRSYYKYYLQDMAELAPDKQEFLKNPKKDPADALRIHDRAKLFEPGYLKDEMGYYMLEDGSAVVSNMTEFEGSTGEMLQWWFGWHGVDPLRYAIWDPYDHYNIEISDEQKAYILDPETSVADKCRGVDHLVTESLVPGEGPVQILIHFRDPAELGYPKEKIFTEACSFMVCANCEILTPDGGPPVPIVMTHFGRDTDYGVELRSRFWMGWHIIDGEPKLLLPPGVTFPEPVVSQLLAHNFSEYSNLAAILPKVYAEEKDNWA